jgi:hypothetical protein
VTLAAMRDTSPSITIVETFSHDIGFESCETGRGDERRMADDGADWRPAILPVGTDDDVHADPWERHPLAHETVCFLCGAVRIYLRSQPEAADDLVRPLRG